MRIALVLLALLALPVSGFAAPDALTGLTYEECISNPKCRIYASGRDDLEFLEKSTQTVYCSDWYPPSVFAGYRLVVSPGLAPRRTTTEVLSGGVEVTVRSFYWGTLAWWLELYCLY